MGKHTVLVNNTINDSKSSDSDGIQTDLDGDKIEGSDSYQNHGETQDSDSIHDHGEIYLEHESNVNDNQENGDLIHEKNEEEMQESSKKNWGTLE